MDTCLPVPVTVQTEVSLEAKKGTRRRRRATDYAAPDVPVWSPQRVELNEVSGVPGLILYSAALQEMLAQVAHWRDSAAPVLITGETGTGKELLARAVHHFSARSRAAVDSLQLRRA